MSNLETSFGDKNGEGRSCVFCVFPLLPSLSLKHLGWNALSYPGAEDITDFHTASPNFSFTLQGSCQYSPTWICTLGSTHCTVGAWHMCLSSCGGGFVFPQPNSGVCVGQGLGRGCSQLWACSSGHPVGATWMGKGKELCNSLLLLSEVEKWLCIAHCALWLWKDSQSNLSRQRLDVSPNILDNRLSAVKTSPPPLIKTQLQETLLSFLPVALKKDSASQSRSGEEVFSWIQSTYPFPIKKIWQSSTFKTR